MKKLLLPVLIATLILLLITSCVKPNNPPVFSAIPDQNINEGDTLELNLLNYVTDPDGDALTFTIVSGPGTITGSLYRFSPNYDEAGVYLVKIKVNDGREGTAQESFLVTVSGTNRPPNIPKTPTPADGATGVPVDNTLSWECSDPDGDSLTYDVYFGTNSNPPLVKVGHTSTLYIPGTLQYGTTYYWKIVAKDGNGWETAGPVWSFFTDVNMSILKIWNLSDAFPDNSGPIYSSPVMDPYADVYVGSQTNLYRIESSTDYTDGYYEFSSPTPEIYGSPIVDYSSGYLYVGNKAGEFLFYDTLSESGYWITLPYSYSLHTAPIIYGDSIFIIDYYGVLYKISKSGYYVNSTIITDGYSRIWSDPVRYGSKLFVATNDGKIIAFDLDTYTKAWQKSTGDSFYGGMALDKFGNLYVAGESLHSYTPNGNLRWSLSLDSQAYANPVISADGDLYIGSIEGKFYSIDISNGSVNWIISDLGLILSSALIADNGIIYFAGGTHLIAMHKDTGDVLGSIELDNFVESSPVLHDYRLFVGTESGKLYVIDVSSYTIEDEGISNWPMFQRNWYHDGSM